MNEPDVRKNRKTLLILAAVFLLPVILAKLALENDWFNRAATNRGELLAPTLALHDLVEGYGPKWRLLYVMPPACDAGCKNALYSMQQLFVAVGKERERVEALVVVTDKSDPGALLALRDMTLIRHTERGNEDVNRMFNPVPTDGIFIVDTHGNGVLRYPVEAEKQQAVLRSRDILADLKKLLKLSRIG